MNFHYWGRELAGVDEPYNTTAKNERLVELAIAFDWMNHRPSDHGLELGNVLAHYGYQGHRVVDLYEHAAGVENIDVFDIAGTYEWVLSVSTLEHIDDAISALGHLRSLVAPGGAMLVTVGSGQHDELDAYLATGAGAARCCTLIRVGAGWEQTVELTFLPYGATTKWAESVWIGEWEA